MTPITQKIFSSGPFSAVRPYVGNGDSPVGSAEEIKEPNESFERSDSASVEEKSSPPLDDLQRDAASSGMQAALSAFPQVVHLLVDPNLQWGENLAKEVGLPVISLAERNLNELAVDLKDPKFADGFILEGYPSTLEDAGKLDSLLKNVAPEDRRVLSWQLTDESHQEVLDHYMDQDLLWMVPESCDAANPVEAQNNILSCLHGLPALR